MKKLEIMLIGVFWIMFYFYQKKFPLWMEILDFQGCFLVKFVLLVNSCVEDQVDMSRGLKPRDPLIIFVFTSVASMWIRLMLRVEEIGLLEGLWLIGMTLLGCHTCILQMIIMALFYSLEPRQGIFLKRYLNKNGQNNP